jgi:hypothetical protein
LADLDPELIEDLERRLIAADRALVEVRHSLARLKKSQRKGKESARETPGPRGEFDLLAEELCEIYPHGSTNAGGRRPPGLKLAARALKAKVAAGYPVEEIRAGVLAFAKEVGTNSRYSPALCRWLEEERWREVYVAPIKLPPTEEEIREKSEAEKRRREEQLARSAEAFGVEIGKDPEQGLEL